MRPILFHLFGHPVSAFGVMVAAGMLAALFWTLLEARRAGLDPQLFVDLFWRVTLAGVLGARLLYCAVHREEWRDGGPLALIAVWRGGLVLYGGLGLAIATGVFFVVRRGQPVLRCFDVSSPGMWLGVAIGRLGCWCVADDWGRPTDVAWAVRFPPLPGSRLDPALFGVALHPTQLYDSLNALLAFLAAAAVVRVSVRPGRAAGAALTLYSCGRFVVERFRGDDVARGMWGPLSTSQWIAILAAGCGIALATLVSERARGPASGAAG
jgi:phosphatidylglycerol:prolipoprotein diacylglycerol transferase